MTDNKDDVQLVSGLKANNSLCHDLLVSKYGNSLLGLSLNMGLSREDGIEVVNDVFIKVIKNIDRFDPNRDTKFFSWLAAIAKNCIKDKFRGLTKTPSGQSLDKLEENGFQAKEDIWDEPEQTDSYEGSLSKELIKKALKKLNHRDQKILMERVFGIPHKDIAKSLNMSEGSVKTAYHRALKKLKEMCINLIESMEDKNAIIALKKHLLYENTDEKATYK